MKPAFLRVLTSAILLAFLFAAALPISAYADEGTPPPTEEPAPPPDEGGETAAEEAAPSEEVASDPVEEAAPSEEVASDPVEEAAPSEEVASEAVEEPAASEEIASEAVEEAAPSDEVVSEPVDEPAPSEEVSSDPVDEIAPSDEVSSEPVEEVAPSEDLAEVLADLPDGTELVVVNEEGEQLSLASQEAADIAAGGDPMWCPLGITPGSPTCSEDFGSFSDLVSWLYTVNSGLGPNANGVIWIEAGYDSSLIPADSGVSWYLDGAVLTDMASHSLNIKGGWSGANNTTIVPNDKSMFDGSSLAIYGWIGDVTLSDIVFTNGPWDGLYVDTEGKVTLTKVDATNNGESGVEIYNDYDAKKDVVITTGDFSNNGNDPDFGGDGLEIYSNGMIRLTNVTASGNQMSDWYASEYWYEGDPETYWEWVADYGNGAELYNWEGKGIVVQNSTFESNEGDGLRANSGGAITLTNVTAIGNIYSEYYDEGQPEIDQGFHGGDGAYLNTWWAAAPAAITLTGTNVFGENGADGLRIWSTGAIKINNIIANANGWTGAVVNNCWYDAGACMQTQPITLTGTNEFKFNGEGGIYAYSGGAIMLNNITATNNSDWEGAWLENYDSPLAAKPGITLTGTNLFNENGADGLHVWTRGTIMLNNVTAIWNGYSNGGDGADLDNYDGLAKAVTLTGMNLFDGNEDDGLEVYSRGAISVANLTSNNNGWWGAYLDNVDSIAPQPVLITGKAEFQYNGDSGLEAYSKGNITVNNIYSNENGSHGAFLDNTAGLGTVTVTGTATFLTTGGGFFDNVGSGLEVYSKGIVNLRDLDFIGNGEYGLFVDNTGGPAAAVTVGTTLAPYCSGAQDNGLSGMEIYSNGVVTMNRICNSDNGGYGALVDNSSAGSAKAVTFTGLAYFRGNGLDGLHLASKGAITAANLTAKGNGWDATPYVDGFGVYLDNTFGNSLAPQNVTLNGFVDVENNFYSGIEVWTYGAITANNVYADYNGWGEFLDDDKYGYGARFDNDNGTLSRPVTLNGTNEFFSNWNGGLLVDSLGAIKVNNLDAWNNHYRGANLWNGAGVGGITISGHGWVSQNGSAGLYAGSTGPIALANADAWNNGWTTTGYGVQLDNTFSGDTTPQNVTITGSNSFWENDGSGLEVYSYGMISATNLNAGDNGWGSGGNGVVLDNCLYDGVTGCLAVTPKAVVVSTNDYFTGNEGYGLLVESLGAITASNLHAWNNGGHGVELDNAWDGAVGGVTLNGTNEFDNNGGDGLLVYSKGAIKANNLSASENTLEGALLDNTFSSDTTPQNVTLTGNNSFWDNDGSGLEVYSYGMIKTTNLDAVNNGWGGSGGDGVYLDNNDGFLPRSVVVSTNDNFQWNEGYGLYVESLGAITVGNLLAEGNGDDGVYLTNIFAGAVGGITLNGTNEFWGNTGNGLTAYSYGAIKANNLSAWGNTSDGVHLDNDWGASTTGATVTLTGSNDFGNNGGDGLYILSWRAVTLSNVESYGNHDYGVFVDNTDAGTVSPQNVTISGTNEFDDNGMDGLWITSYGVIALSNITANDNGQYNYWAEAQLPPEPLIDEGRGVYLNNCGFNYGLWEQDCTLAESPKAISLTGVNTFNGNFFEGLVAVSLGAINGNSVTANWNGSQGAYLDNWWGQPFASGVVKLTGTNHFEGNGNDGLQIYSHGTIALNNATANWNAGDGAYLENQATTGPQVNVILTGTNTFNSNGDWSFPDESWGLEVWSEGNITINNLTANWNDLGGAYLNNWEYSYLTPTVTLTGANNFLANQFDGLVIEAWGAVSLSKVVADANGSDGVNVYSEVGNITLTCGSMTSNGGFGLYLDAGGTITLKGVYALGNGINTWFSPFPPTVYRSC